MSSFTVTVEGLPRLLGKLNPTRYVPGFQDFFSRSGKAVAQQAQTLSPKLTGHLAGSIRSRSFPNFAEVSTDVRYGFYQEFGTHKMQANPFMRPALKAAEPQVQGLLSRLASRIKSAFGA